MPMLFLTGIDKRTAAGYYGVIREFLRSGKRDGLEPVLEAVLMAAVGALTRAEVFYFLVRVQSLVTGAYKQRYDMHQVIPAETGRIVG